MIGELEHPKIIVVYYKSRKRELKAKGLKIETRFRVLFVYYESIKREPKIRGIYECRCDERLQTETMEGTRLSYTGLYVELEYLKIETRLTIEKFASEMGEYVTER